MKFRKIIGSLVLVGATTASVATVVSCSAYNEGVTYHLSVDTSLTASQNNANIERHLKGVKLSHEDKIIWDVTFKDKHMFEVSGFKMQSILAYKALHSQSGEARVMERLSLGFTSWVLTQSEMIEIINSMPAIPADEFE